MQRTPPLGAQPWTQRFLPCFTKRCRADIGWIVSQAPHHTAVPHGLPGARHLARLREPAADLPNRLAVASHPVKDLADKAGFVGHDLIPRVPPTDILRNIAVPIRCSAEYVHNARLRRMPLAPSVAFNDCGPLLLGKHPLDLQEQVIFRALAQGSVQENHFHPGAPELIHQQHLVGILPG